MVHQAASASRPTASPMPLVGLEQGEEGPVILRLVIRDRNPHIPVLWKTEHSAMEVPFAPELEKQLNDLATQSGRAVGELVQEAVAGYASEVSEVSEMLNSRYDDIKNSRLKLIDDEEAFARLHEKIEARRNSPA